MEAQLSSRSILVLATCAGLVTAFGELFLLAVQKFVLGRFVRFGPDVIWMAPVADLCLFLTAGICVLAVPERWRRLKTPPAVVGLFAFLASLSLLLLYQPLHGVARVLLAGGVAVHAGRLARGRWLTVKVFARRSLPWLAGLSVVLTAAFAGAPRVIAWQRSTSPKPSGEGIPNVLLIVLDTVRAGNLSLYGYHRLTTPRLDRWAASSLLFDHASSTSPWTLPSHASLFTGRWPHELSANWEEALDTRDQTLAEFFGAHGYLTAGFVANTHYCGYEFGLDRGFERYEDYVVSPEELLVASSLVRNVANSNVIRRVLGFHDNIPRRDAETITGRVLSWLDAVEGRPFFAFVNYFDAHEPYLPPVRFAEKFGPDSPRSNERLIHDLRRSLRLDWTSRPRTEIQVEIDQYDGAIAYLDEQVDRLLVGLRDRGILDNTVVVVTSDHGEQFGEHGLFVHANSLYDPVLHVPLLVRYPARVPAGRRIATQVTLRDVPATLVDLAGLSGSSRFPGSPLARHWSDQPDDDGEPLLAEVRYSPWAPASYPTARGDLHLLMDGRYRYIRNGDGREELYTVDSDPEERRDLSGAGDSRPLLEKYRLMLGELLRADPR